jgi:hypothetical protein
MDDPNDTPDLVDDMREEIMGMAKEGMHHPSTKPVLIGAAVGAAAGWALPLVSVPVGLIAGAGFMLYKRVRP